MYNLSQFKENDNQIILEFIEKYPFAVLIGSFDSGFQTATQIPLLLVERDGDIFLQGHIMRNTDHYKAFLENKKALVMFTGPTCYVSATWYNNPNIGSTWNYMTVQVSGTLSFMSEDDLISLMKKLTLKFESENFESSTIFDNLPNSYLNRMIPAIVGIEIKVNHISSIFKLSQDKDETSYLNVISKLESLGGENSIIASEMKKRKDSVFLSCNEDKPFN
ncbi:FMN-binding negative transcriptional regulator [Algoriphagus marincola]|uniref:FMN-binding negative transcriptional regulator n=1 Tax=Algoriphagus marincola TaxID=264027 RepID=UPI0004016E06|nr:FMN-binding negative transcriptional regulator [Algoriphagus marincola]